MHAKFTASGDIQATKFEFNDEFSQKKHTENVKNGRIYLAVIAANISSLAVGACMSWPSPVGLKLGAHDLRDSPLSRTISADENAWISSIVAVGALITPFIAGPMADKIGRKKVLLLSSIFFIMGFVFMLVAKEVWVLLIGRLIKGFGIGFVMSIAPMYVAEISNDQTRAATGSFMSFFIAGGIHYVYCIGPFVSYQLLQYFCLLIPILFDVAFIFMPESPYYLIAKGQKTEALKSLKFLRGQSTEAVQNELISIENMVTSSMAQKSGITEIIKSAGNRKAIFICLGLIFFQQVSGINAVLFNSEKIFESAHMNLSGAIASIIVGTLQLLSAAVTPFVSNNLERKTILIGSAVFMSIGLAALGYFFFLQIVLGDASGLSWLPVPALVLYMVAFTMGFGPLPWTILGEMFPPNVKSIASAMTASSCWTFGFLVALFYPTLEAFGTYFAFWLFSGFCILALFFSLFIVMETSSLSLQEIQNKLNKKI